MDEHFLVDVNVLNDNSLGCVRLEITGKANLLVAITHPPSWKSSAVFETYTKPQQPQEDCAKFRSSRAKNNGFRS